MPRPRTVPSPDELIAGIRAGNRAKLAQAITLIESNAAHHRAHAQTVLQTILPESGRSIRVGVTGVPGAGKSTFLEALGCWLCERNHRVAVLAVDPSSSRSGGSILGDKTRMEHLASHPRAFIRPSPSGQSSGGVAHKTREAMLLCEAAGYDVIFIETVGVGQSETAVRTMTDFFLLLQIVGAGDELQGIKKGVIELADAILVNKADGDNILPAKRTRSEYARVLQLLHPFTPGWQPQAQLCSALKHTGIDSVWQLIETFKEQTQASGVFDQRRAQQNVDWFQLLLRNRVLKRFNETHQDRIAQLEQRVGQGELPVSGALDQLFNEQ